MLQRPEIGSREHVLLFLAGEPQDEAVDYMNRHGCACARYASRYLSHKLAWIWGYPALWNGFDDGFRDNSLNAIGARLNERGPFTYGQLYQAALKEWQ